MSGEMYQRVREYAHKQQEGWSEFLRTVTLDDFLQVCEDRGLTTEDAAIRHWRRWSYFNSRED